MTEVQTEILPFLFIVLIGMIVVNLLTTVCLYFVSRIENIKVLSWYWTSLLLTYLFQVQFQNVEMGIMLSFSVNIIPCLLMGKILADALNQKFPYKRYLMLWSGGVLTSAVFKIAGLPFALAALPMCFPIALTLIEPGYSSLVTHRAQSSIVQKFMGGVFIFGGLHVFNFALFRMQPGTQMWGWVIALSNYQVLSLSLFAFAFEEYSSREKQRLQELVEIRTNDLTKALQIKDTLFKVVVHDIANPITAQSWVVASHAKGKLSTEEAMARIERIASIIIDQIYKVRTLGEVRALDLELRPVKIDQCLRDLQLLFEGPLNSKNLKLVIANELPEGTMFMGDQNAFTNSVLSNLVSNAIKFSEPNKELRLSAFLKSGRIVIEVQDQGIGMPAELIANVFDPKTKSSRLGTLGEKGTGYGMPLAKSFIDRFGGEIEVESHTIDAYPHDHGTKITLSLDQVLGH